MRTTLNLDDDVMEMAKAMAEQRRLPIGTVVSELARRGLRTNSKSPATRNGIKLFPVRTNAKVVTPEIVKEIFEESV